MFLKQLHSNNTNSMYAMYNDEMFVMYDSPGWKSKIIPSRILITSLHSKRCVAELPLRVGLIRGS